MSPASHQHDPFWDSLWGLILTLAFGTLIFIIFSVIQTTILIIYGYSINNWNQNINFEHLITQLYFDGFAISLAEIPAVIIGCSLVFTFTKLRLYKNDNIAHYLQLNLAPLKTSLKWLGVMTVIIVLLELSYIVLERDTPDFMTKVYSSARYYPLLWLAVIIAAPIFEELLFRGFLLEGLRHTVLGNIGAIFITSASWAMVHAAQYDWFEVFTIFIIGLIFSYAKLSSKSLLVPIAMHMLMNLTATVLMEIK